MDWSGLLDGMTDTVRNTFGQPASYTRKETGETFEIQGVFDPDYLAQDANGSVKATSGVPVLDVKLSDIGDVDPAYDDTVTVDGKNWVVADTHPSSSGMVKMQLRRVRG